MDVRNSVLPSIKDILNYCFNPPKVGENRGY